MPRRLDLCKRILGWKISVAMFTTVMEVTLKEMIIKIIPREEVEVASVAYPVGRRIPLVLLIVRYRVEDAAPALASGVDVRISSAYISQREQYACREECVQCASKALRLTKVRSQVRQ